MMVARMCKLVLSEEVGCFVWQPFSWGCWVGGKGGGWELSEGNGGSLYYEVVGRYIYICL